LNLGGGTISSVSGYLGYESGSNGSATLTGGDWSNSSSLFVGSYGTGTLDLNGGSVSVDLGNGTVRLAVQAGSTGTLNLGTGDTAGTLAAAVIEGGSGTATVNFNHAASSYTFSPMLTGTLSVNHSGTGTTILTGSNTYTGATTVSSGTLNITGSSASNITVYPDAALGGEGTMSGSLTFTAGPSTLLFDPATQAGALTAATAEVTGALVLVKPTGATSIGTTYTVLKLTAGTFSGDPTDHFVTACRATLAFANGNTELTCAPTIASLTWQGDTANPSFWDVATTANWENHGPDQFYPNDDVTFDDTASSFAVAVQGAAVTPGHTVFANSANAYSVSGGGIGGGSLTKTGSHTVTIHSALSNTGGITVADGVLILAAPNTFTGGIAITGGELRFGARERLNPDANTLTLGSGTITYDGISPMTNDTMQVNVTASGSELRTDTAPSINWRIGGKITGSGNWSKSGAGVLTLGRNSDGAAINDFTGTLTVTAGAVDIRHANCLGGSINGTFIQSATLLMQNFGQTSGRTVIIPEPLNFSGASNFSVLNRENKTFTDKFAGPVSVSGMLNISSGITTGAQVPGFEINGPVATSSGATLAFGVQGGYPVPLTNTAQAIRIGGVITGPASVTVQGGTGSVFTLSLPGYSGNTTVQSGRLKLEAANANNESSTIGIAASGATLDLSFAGTDTVGKLFVGGVQQNAGVYEAIGNTGTGNEIAQITGIGTLTVTSGPAYQMWIGSFTTIPAGERDPDDDPDGDGKSNLLEFATDDDPSSPLASGKVAGKVVDKMLTLSLPVRGTMAATTFSGTTDQVSVPVDGITYRIQGARDLAFGGAYASVVSEVVPALVADLPPLSDPGWEYRTFRTAGTSVSQSADFLRAVIEAAP
jgi:T5SS/PEP-CTERM-associated repeat protein/autotransporter-associated beta strand protein